MSKTTVTCQCCTHEWDLDDGPAPEQSILVCSECGGRMSYGRLEPVVVIEPFVDERGHAWVRHRIQDPVTRADAYVFDLDPQHAMMVAKATISLVIP